MRAPVALHSDAKPRDRSIAARRAGRRAKFERERLIVDCLNRGVSAAEIARPIGVTEKRMRALTKEILARRMPAAPEDFAALQVSRLNEALLAAYGAMSAENLRAVALVVRIVRELDRYHGFAAAARLPGRDPRPAEPEAEASFGLAETASQEPERISRGLPDAAPRQAFVPAPAQDPAARCAARGSPDRPEMAPQALEMTRFAPEKGAPSEASDEARPARDGSQGAVGAIRADEAVSPPVAAPPIDRPETAPQAPENIDSAPGNGGSVAPAPATPRSRPRRRRTRSNVRIRRSEDRSLAAEP